MKLLNLIICFFVCLPLVMMEHTYAGQIKEIHDLSELDFDQLTQIESHKTEKTLKALNQKLEVALKKAQRKNHSKEQFVSEYLRRLDRAQNDKVRMVNKTLKPKKINKLYAKVSKHQADLKREDLESSLRDSIQLETLSQEREEVESALNQFENESSLLEYLKQELNHGKLSLNKEKSPSRAIASDIVLKLAITLLCLAVAAGVVLVVLYALSAWALMGVVMLIPGVVIVLGLLGFSFAILSDASWF